ncbi:MAG: ClpXP protease specificity-enhancing factor [Burkholderiales bacterium]|nr:MAG: ClpXP protease specificity-enhancing factor [Burkholderiales bacterium]
MPETSTKPYLIRAIHEWCSDNGLTPYIAVSVDDRTIVPRAFVKGGEIVLNVSSLATNRLRIGNESIDFEARFGGVARHISVPIENVSAIYARESGHGMAFEVPRAPAVVLQARPEHGESEGQPGGSSVADAHGAADAPELGNEAGAGSESDRAAAADAGGDAADEGVDSTGAAPAPRQGPKPGKRLTLALPAGTGASDAGTPDDAPKAKPRPVRAVARAKAAAAGERDGLDGGGADADRTGGGGTDSGGTDSGGDGPDTDSGGGRGKRGKPRLTRVK